jgi:hypothetical protein
MPHQHVHNLTPYPHSAEGSAFPFPTIPAKQDPMQLQPQRTPSSSSSTSSSYASFRYPTPHAQSYPSASFPLKLSTIHSPVPPSLLQRRRSSCCTVSSMDSLASASTTSSWGNWSVDSPVPGLSRSGSSSSRTGAGVGEDLKTPETVLFGDFEDELSLQNNNKLSVEQGSEQEEEEDFALSHSGLVSAMKTKSTMARPRLFVKLAEPERKTGPRLQRTQTPLELWTMRSQRSAAVQEEEMEMKEEDITSIKTITRPTSTTTPTRPKLERKLTPHPATGPASTQHLKGAFPSTSSASDFAFAGLVLVEEVDEDEQAESSEEKAKDEEEEKSTRPSSLWDISLPPATRGRPIHRMALGRRFSSVIEEGKVWLAV